MNPIINISVAGENALILYLADNADSKVAAQIQSVTALITANLGPMLIDIIPSYASILIIYDPHLTDHFAVSKEIQKAMPEAEYYSDAKCTVWGQVAPQKKDKIFLLCAGTSDLKVAEEAQCTLKWLGYNAETYSDIGVAGLHRLLSKVEQIQKAQAIIVFAGMEAALASVIAGLVPSPIIAVPTSVGYGSSFEGLAALLGMLNSCSPGIGVVNIDNGFGGAMLAHRIIQAATK